jgi:hypothetical protein
MSIRDDEINRLVKYAQGLNVQVKFIPSKGRQADSANWTTDGKEINVFVRKTHTKLHIILSLLHEICHQIAFIYNRDRLPDPELEEAIDPEIERKYLRKRILDWEIEGTKWWETVYKETDCKFDINKLYAEKALDIWIYEYYYENGQFPKKQQMTQKRKELRSKYK